MTKDKFPKKSIGFTIIELLVVITVIGALSGMVLAVINPAEMQRRGRDSQRVADLKKLQAALEIYYSDFRKYPTGVTFGNISTRLAGLVPNYIGSLPVDPLSTNAGAYTCGGNYAYSYRVNDDTSASRYAIVAKMETDDVDYVLCSEVYNCATLGWCNCSNLCHAVQNPL